MYGNYHIILCKMCVLVVFIFFFFGLTSQSTNFQSCLDEAKVSWVLANSTGLICLAQEHNATALGFKPWPLNLKSNTLTIRPSYFLSKMSHCIRKPTNCICKNKGTDQLCSVTAQLITAFVFTTQYDPSSAKI